jgi:hypothetical protein
MIKTAPIIYLIRHGEKPPKNADGSDADGLSTQGVERAQGLRKVFGKDSPYHIKHIIAEHPKKGLFTPNPPSIVKFQDAKASPDGSRTRPYETILPLSEDLGLKPDTSIDRDDAKGAAKAAMAYHGPGNVLICWEHGVLSDIVEKLGVEDKAKYPGERFDVIWAVKKPYDTLEWVGSENIEGLDDQDGSGIGGIVPAKDGTGVDDK